jgi:ABC-type bacteriocin/lantibiotic exporter with double-glycine peptidase domain
MQNLFLTRFLSRNIAPIFTADTEENETLEYVRSLNGAIKAEDISFKYPDDSRGCLAGISLDIKKGEKIAIVGESGCGKSTLLKILLGMEKPDSGNVFYDGKTIKSLNLKSLRRCIGSVFQFSRLFPGTIADNIAFGNEEYANDDKIWEAADLAVIGDYIRKLPLTINTEISESNSSGFSGGQRQRLLLARAFFNHPKILILDEATSALDNITQKAVLENIRKMNATVIMVAHRLSTVENFDRIIMLEKGKIAEEGTYSALMEKNGHFAQLVRKQLL